MHTVFCFSFRYARKRFFILKTFGILIVAFLTAIILSLTTVYAEEQMRSSSLNVKKTTNGDTERIDYVDEEGTLLVSEEELTTQLQDAFNASGAGQYTCVNKSV